MGAYEDVVAALSQLTPGERERVAERLRALRSLAPGAPPRVPTPGPAASRDPRDDLVEAIASTVLRLSGERVSPAVLRQVSTSAFAVKAAAVDAFVSQHVSGRVARQALLDLGVELLYQDLTDMGLATSSRALMNHAHRIPSVVDAAFPGYARAGLLGMVVGDKSKRGVPLMEEPQ